MHLHPITLHQTLRDPQLANATSVGRWPEHILAGGHKHAVLYVDIADSSREEEEYLCVASFSSKEMEHAESGIVVQIIGFRTILSIEGKTQD
jgi:hypothetical protein